MINELDFNTDRVISLEPVELQNLYSLYSDCCLKKQPKDEIIVLMKNKMQDDYHFSSNISLLISNTLFKQFSNPNFHTKLLDDAIAINELGELCKSTTPKIQLSLYDYQKYLEMIENDGEITFYKKTLLLAFIIYYRKNFHPTGWVRYDRKLLFYLAGADKISISAQEKMTNYLHTHYDLNMQVVGSNQPIPCFSLSWLQDQPVIGSSNNPLLTFGDLTPKGLRSLVEQIKHAKETI